MVPLLPYVGVIKYVKYTHRCCGKCIQCTQIEWYKVYVVRQHLLLYNMASKSSPAPITCDFGCSFKHVLWAQHSALAVDDFSLCRCHNIHLGPVLTATSVFNPTTVCTNHRNNGALLPTHKSTQLISYLN